MLSKHDNVPILVQSPAEPQPLLNDTVFVGSVTPDDEIDGLELTAAAQVLGISIDEVWKRIRNGLLIARTNKGQVLVYTDMAEALALEGLPPPPAAASLSGGTQSATRGQITRIQKDSEVNDVHPISVQVPSIAGTQELALLIDHLSLAKDENREILRLTQDSMARLTQMTDTILEMKDAIIASKDQQLDLLKQQMTEQSKDLVRVLKEKEDLETLTQALQIK